MSSATSPAQIVIAEFDPLEFGIMPNSIDGGDPDTPGWEFWYSSGWLMPNETAIALPYQEMLPMPTIVI